MSEFKDKVVVITGAGGGLGKSHALNSRSAGQRLLLMIWVAAGMASVPVTWLTR